MAAGVPLTDADRTPWLDIVGAWLGERRERGGVISCSALKRSYRERLRAAAPDIFFVYLSASRAVLARRMETRRGHFMPATLLDSQFATLQPLAPDEFGITVDATADPAQLVREAVTAWQSR